MDTTDKIRGEPPAMTWAEDDSVVVPEEFPDELVDELLARARTGEQISGPDGLLNRLTKRLVERALAAELTDHLGYEPRQAPHSLVGAGVRTPAAREGCRPRAQGQ